jgi:hypothetical protein
MCFIKSDHLVFVVCEVNKQPWTCEECLVLHEGVGVCVTLMVRHGDGAWILVYVRKLELVALF